ncbi:MAG TPA: hypothetical protein ENI89_12635 [Desulfobulbus sp.]|nr:hypothetical protein [Desulfobulbus sp.]
MSNPSIAKAAVLLFSSALSLTLLAGCVTDRRMVSPYEARARREAAIEQQPVRQPARPTPQPGVRQPEPMDSARPAESVVDNDVLMPALTLINDRIFSYEQKLNSWKELNRRAASLHLDQDQVDRINSCRQQLHDILLGYNALHQRLLGKRSISSAQLLAGSALLDLEKRDIEYLESDCSRLLADGGETPQWIEGSRSSAVRKAAEEISDAAGKAEYDRVITLYEKLPLAPGVEAPFEATYQYGIALMKNHREADARKIFSDLLAAIRKKDQAQREFRLMQLLGDLNFGLDVYDAARERYEEIMRIYKDLGEKNEWARQQLAALKVSDQQGEEVKAYAALLRSYLAYNPDRDGFKVVQQAEKFVETYPYSPVSSSADYIVEESRKLAEKWFSDLMARVDALEKEKKFQEALLLIERIPRDILPLDKQEELKTRTGELTTAESIAIETERLVREQALQENWNTAMTHLEAREYDKAIEAFSKLLGTTYDARARARIDEAARLAAQEDRQRAAELFVRANRTHDQQSRIKLLLASRNLLQGILVKYPQSELIDKVKRNLARIEEELKAIDPALLTGPETVEGRRPAGEAGAGVTASPGMEPLTRPAVEPAAPSFGGDGVQGPAGNSAAP